MLQQDEKSGTLPQDVVTETEQMVGIPSLVDIDQSTQQDDYSARPADRQDTMGVEDSGKEILYRGITTKFPFKTSDRLLDDLVHDLSFINSQDHDILYSDLSKGILRAPVLTYSRRISQLQAYSFGTLIDQVALQTSFEYPSISCPAHNKLNVYMGVLIDVPHDSEAGDTTLTENSVYHVKVTVKTRSVLEHTKKRAGVVHYHCINEADLHPFDRRDLLTFDCLNPSLVDYAIYISSDTNKLVLVEIFQPEFDRNERIECWSEAAISARYADACKRFKELDPKNVPTPADCINTLLKIFRGPLNRQNSEEPTKTINSDNVTLNSRINPNWLTSKYGFELHVEKDDETGESYYEFEPPNLTNYVKDGKTRALRESFIRKCIELIFLGKTAVEKFDKDAKTTSKVYRTFNMLQTTFSRTAWFKMLGEHKSIFSLESASPLDVNYHFINLSACFYYIDRDIIKNYETQCALDPENSGIYFDALTFIANRKGAYQLVSYCGKQDVVGQEALDQSLRLFGIDSKDVDVSTIDDTLLLSVYKSEVMTNTSESHHADMKNALRLVAKCKKSDKLRFFADYEPYRNTSRGYEILEVDESVDDDIIETAYSISINDSPGLKIDCDRALYTIAIHKRSLRLFNYLLQQCPEFQQYYGPDSILYQEALRMLQLNENASDETVLEVFQRNWYQETAFESDYLLKLKAALSKIGFERNSKLILHFIDTGTIDAGCLPADNWPTGLNNIGNTCYLNSLLQYYFSLAPLRQYVLDYQETIEHFRNHPANESRRIGGREVSEAEVERSVQFLYQLRDLFHAMIYSKERCVTPRKELAYLAFAPSNFEVEFEPAPAEAQQQMPTIPEISNSGLVCGPVNKPSSEHISTVDLSAEPNDDDFDVSMTNENPEEVKDEVSLSSVEKDNIVSTSTRVAKISSDQLENALEMGRQQDVTECIGNVLFQLESASDPISLDEDNEQNDLVKQLFYGKIKQTIIPLANSAEVRTKVERYLSLLVNIGDHPKDIYDALDSYFSDEHLTMAEYGEVKRTVAVTEFPTILQIQIQRVYYDRERFMPFKSIEPLPFGETLYMDRYSDSQNPKVLEKKKESKLLKSQLLNLKKRQKELLSANELGLSRKAAYMETINYLKSDLIVSQGLKTDNKDFLIEQLHQSVTDIDSELTSLYHGIANLENRIDNLFEEFKEVGYSLFAVFIHRGEASYGHYWVYIKDRSKNGIWRKYNDETITEVPETEVFNFAEGNTATPYFLVYVRQGHEHDIEPLKRVVNHS